MPKKRDTDPDVQEIFDEAQAKAAPRSKKPLTSKDMGNEKPQRLSVTDAFQRAIEKRPNVLELMADKVLDNVTGETPDFRYVKELWERFDGKVITPFTLTGFENLTDEQLAAYRETLTRAKG